MSTLYITEQGAKLRKESKRLIVEKENQVLLEIPEFKIERVFIFGNVQLTTQVLKFLLESGTDVSFFTYYGKFIGKLFSAESKNIFLRIAQYEKYDIHQHRIDIAKILILAKVKNSKNVLLKYARNHPEVDFSFETSQLDKIIAEIPRKAGTSSLMGIEGTASSIYFGCFGKMLIKNFNFEKRETRPAKDPVNSMLNFGYALLTNELFSSLSARGFDPYLGFFHSTAYGRPSLALDLMEEFRQPIIDRLVIELINKEVIKPDQFEEVEGKIYLNAEARKEYLKNYERRMQTKVKFEEKNLSYREIIHHQVEKFANWILKNHPYEPFEIK